MKLNDFIEQDVLTDPEWAAAYEPSQLRRESARMLARARVEQKLSQAELAERCQTDQAVISRIERGVVSPSLDTLSRLAKGLGLRPVLHFERRTNVSPPGVLLSDRRILSVRVFEDEPAAEALEGDQHPGRTRCGRMVVPGTLDEGRHARRRQARSLRLRGSSASAGA